MEIQNKVNTESLSSLEQKLIYSEWIIKNLFKYKNKSKEEKRDIFLEYLDIQNQLIHFDKNN